MEKKPCGALPSLPGVYLFKNNLNEVIYIGKAQSIKKRVQSYFNNDDWKIKALIDDYASLDHIVTKNEEEALLLEAQLIQEHKPKFNVLLKSGQPFIYIVFTHEQLPKVRLVRNKKEKGTYFGPFLHKKQARSVYEYLLKTFRLTWCTTTIKEGCLNYHLELCAGNCRDDFDSQDYLFRVQLAINVLKNNYNKSLDAIKERIYSLNHQLEFEKAKHLYEYLQHLDTIFSVLKTKFSEKRYKTDIFFATTPMHTRKVPDVKLATMLQDFLQTAKPIVTLDCFDISHFQGNNSVGSCIRFTHGIPDKHHFRRFAIKSVQQNDYAALQEIVVRRYKQKQDIPDLIVIDGGKGQLHAIQQVIDSVDIVSLAKKEERLFMNRFPEGIVLDVSTPVGQLFIALRDYAHHFAIQYHRFKRNKLGI